MKTLKIFKTVLIAGVLLLASCTQEKKLKESQFDFSKPVKTGLDNWLNTTFADSYNIKVYYKWNQNLVDNNRYLFPPHVDKVQPAMEVVKKIWIDSYTAIGGDDFIKKIAPREFVLVGGVNQNTNGTATLGLAESGQRITFFEVDNLDTKSRESVTLFIHTIQHEYVHILNMNRAFDEKAWARITPSYNPAWYNPGLIATAKADGFITGYARSDMYEDFAEMVSTILTTTQREYDAILNNIGSLSGAQQIKAKEALVVQYYKEAFNIDIYALRDEAQRNTNAIIK